MILFIILKLRIKDAQNKMASRFVTMNLIQKYQQNVLAANKYSTAVLKSMDSDEIKPEPTQSDIDIKFSKKPKALFEITTSASRNSEEQHEIKFKDYLNFKHKRRTTQNNKRVKIHDYEEWSD